MGIELVSHAPYFGSASLAYCGMQVNGAMEVAQSRVQHTGMLNTSTVVADQWYAYCIGPTAVVTTQQVPGPPGYGFALRLLTTTAETPLGADSWALFYQLVEGYRFARMQWGTAQAQMLGMSFWVRSNVAGQVFSVVLRNASSTRNYTTDVTIGAADVWQYVTLYVPGDTTGTWETTTAAGLHVLLTVANGLNTQAPTLNTWVNGNYHGSVNVTNLLATVNNYVELTGVLLVPGNELPTATQAPSIVRLFNDEFLLCQRYWEKSYDYPIFPSQINQSPGTMQACSASTTLMGYVRFMVRKRVVPTITVYNWSTGVTGTVYSSTAGSPASVPNWIGETGYTDHAVVTAKTRYQWHWVANARL